MSDQRYNSSMKTLTNALKIDSSDVAKFRFKVLETGACLGWQVACDVFNVSKATYFRWQEAYRSSNNSLASLVPRSTKPTNTRKSQVDPRLIEFIAQFRHDYGNIGREKIKVFLDDYAQGLGIETISARTIGRIISQRNLFEPGRKVARHRQTNKFRSKKAPKVEAPGFAEVDSVTLYRSGRKYYFVCCIDVYSKLAYASIVGSLTSANARDTFNSFQESLPFDISIVQTDNGHEFLKDFDASLQSKHIFHQFTQVRSPKINGCIERFNQTIQTEFLDRTDAMTFDPKRFQSELADWLSWYNECRPHVSLGYLSPQQFLQSGQSQM